MQKKYLIIAAASGFLCVALGAFGAHGLKEGISTDLLQAYETGVRYQFYHTLILFFISLSAEKMQPSMVARAAFCFILGILLFSGSLYAMALSGINGTPVKALGIITPVGGVFFLAGWLALLVGIMKANK